MSYKYRVVQKTTNLNGTRQTGYVAAVSNQQVMTSDDVNQAIEHASSLSIQDVKILSHGLAQIVRENTNMGRGTKLDELGTVLPNLHSEGTDSMDEFSAKNIDDVKINFRPASDFRKAMDRASVELNPQLNLKHE